MERAYSFNRGAQKQWNEKQCIYIHIFVTFLNADISYYQFSSYVYEQLNGSVKEPNKFHIYETEKINRKASDVAEYIELFGFFDPRSSCTTHLMLFSECPPIYASSCMTISVERTEQLDIFPPITQSCSVSDVVFTGGRGVSDFIVLKYY